MASEPIRERAKSAIVARLEAIEAGATYWYTPSLVTRVLLNPDQYTTKLATGPVLGVQRSSGSKVERDTHDPGTYEHVLIVDINAYVLGDVVGGTPADTKLERVWSDVRTSLLGDPRLGGLASMDVTPDGEMETDRGTWEPIGWMRQPWRVRLNEDVA